MRIKTLPKIVKEIRTLDSASAICESFLAYLTENDELPYTYHGNRLVADADALMPTLNRLFGLEENGKFPHIRSIRDAVAELKLHRPEIGIGEKRIRGAIRDGRIPSVLIGNREYIAMECFEEPYCIRILGQPVSPRGSRTEKIYCDVMDQVSQTISASAFVPCVTRIRRA